MDFLVACSRTMSELPYSPGEVGKRIAALREGLGVHQAEMARQIGVLPAELSAWENGVRRPSIAKARPLVDLYGVTLDWLFLGDPSNLPHRIARIVLPGTREASRSYQD